MRLTICHTIDRNLTSISSYFGSCAWELCETRPRWLEDGRNFPISADEFSTVSTSTSHDLRFPRRSPDRRLPFSIFCVFLFTRFHFRWRKIILSERRDATKFCHRCFLWFWVNRKVRFYPIINCRFESWRATGVALLFTDEQREAFHKHQFGVFHPKHIVYWLAVWSHWLWKSGHSGLLGICRSARLWLPWIVTNTILLPISHHQSSVQSCSPSVHLCIQSWSSWSRLSFFLRSVR